MYNMEHTFGMQFECVVQRAGVVRWFQEGRCNFYWRLDDRWGFWSLDAGSFLHSLCKCGDLL